MRVSPRESAPRISARCDTDLSPGTRAVPARAGEGRAVAGWGVPDPWGAGDALGAVTLDMDSLDMGGLCGAIVRSWWGLYHAGEGLTKAEALILP